MDSWEDRKKGYFIKKQFSLSSNYSEKKGKLTIDDLNQLLNCAGISFNIKTGKKLIVEIDEKKFKAVTNPRIGRPEKEIDFDLVAEMKSDGKTNKEICTALGISKSLFYVKMKEFKENIK